MFIRRNSFVFFLIVITSSFFSQTILNTSLADNQLEYKILSDTSINYKKRFHSSVKPFTELDVMENLSQTKLNYNPKVYKSSTNILPVLNLCGFVDNKGAFKNFAIAGAQFYTDFRFKIFGDAKPTFPKIALSVTALGGYTQPLNYIDSTSKYSKIIPGFGYAYKTQNAYSFQNISGYLSFSPNKIFNFQLGKDKHFWGDGHRSLFLSDFSNNYFFGKITTTIWKVKYVNLYTMHKDITSNTLVRKNEKNKYATFHYLSWNLGKRINMGIFESIVWQGSDTTRNRTFEPHYLNPVLFYRPTEYSLGSSDNAYFGASFNWRFWKNNVLYGQVLLDEFLLKEIKGQTGWWANKQAYQVGLKSYDFLTVKNLFARAEFNYVRPYTYSHGSVQQNYGHFNQPLAHPLGANFQEAVVILNYTQNNWLFEVQGIYAQYGIDTSIVSYGKNIFLSYTQRPYDYGVKTTQGLKTDLIYATAKVSYLIYPAMNLRAEAGLIIRNERNLKYTLNTGAFYLALKTNLFNTYFDY